MMVSVLLRESASSAATAKNGTVAIKARSVGEMSFILICRVLAKVVSNFELLRSLIDGEKKGCDCIITLS